jgi:hypothetical protein
MTIRRMRFSLVNAVLLLTIAALGLGLYRNGKVVVPLRNELAWYHEKYGFFSTPNTRRIYIRRSPMKAPGIWQWRVFLPEGKSYELRMFVGQAPDPGKDLAAWLSTLRGSSQGIHGNMPVGKFAYEICLQEVDGRWWIRTGELFDQGASYQLPESCSWLANGGSRNTWSDASYDEVKDFSVTEPFVLLNVEEEQTRTAAGDAPSALTGTPERVVFWIE